MDKKPPITGVASPTVRLNVPVSVGGQTAIEPVGRATSPARKPRKRSAKFDTRYGTAMLRGYPIYHGELFELGGAGVLSSIAFSATTYFGSLAFDIAKDLAFTPDLTPEALAFWTASQDWSIVAAAICGIVGLGIVGFGANKIRNILKRTTFDEE